MSGDADASMVTKLDLYLISSSDIAYEQDILRNPYTLSSWLRYIEHKADAAIHERVFVLERACNDLKRSYKLWKMYLDLRREHVETLNPVKFEDEYAKVNECFERSLILLNKVYSLILDVCRLLTGIDA